MAHDHEVIRVTQDGAVRMTLAFVSLIKKSGEGRYPGRQRRPWSPRNSHKSLVISGLGTRIRLLGRARGRERVEIC